MSFVVSFAPPEAGQTLQARQRRTVRRRCLLSVGAMLLLGGMAAVPLPVWEANRALQERAGVLGGWIDDGQHEAQDVAAFLAEGGPTAAQQAGDEIAHWLAPHDRQKTKETLLATARATGLAVASTELQPDADPLLGEQPPRRDVTVLGASVERAADTTPRVSGTPLPLRADRYVLRGTGPVTSLLLFCGVLPELPVPLRLRSVRLQAEGGGCRFDVIVDKLRDATADGFAEPAR